MPAVAPPTSRNRRREIMKPPRDSGTQPQHYREICAFRFPSANSDRQLETTKTLGTLPPCHALLSHFKNLILTAHCVSQHEHGLYQAQRYPEGREGVAPYPDPLRYCAGLRAGCPALLALFQQFLPPVPQIIIISQSGLSSQHGIRIPMCIVRRVEYNFVRRVCRTASELCRSCQVCCKPNVLCIEYDNSSQ